jgi:hypothetical protein
LSYTLRLTRGRSRSRAPDSGGGGSPPSGAPRIFYTDIISGPNSGAPGGGGCFLSIFGINFGANINSIVVTVGGGTVSSNVFLGSSLGRPDVQWLAVQLGASSATGAIKVSVSGVDSNTDKTFTVRSGTITYYSSIPSEGTIAAMSPGDFAVIRAGTYDAEIYFHTVSGTAGNPLTVMGYPGEAVLIRRNAANALAVHTFYSGSNGTQGHYVICGLDCDMGWDEVSDVAKGGGVIGMGVDLTDIRVVNCKAAHMYENSGGSAAISGSGTNFKVLGCHCKGNGGSKLYHSLYFDGRAFVGGSNGYELGWNWLERQYGGRGIQFFADAGGSTADVYNGEVHHNLIHDICLDGTVFSDRTQTGFKYYDNIAYRTGNHTFNGPASDLGSDGAVVRFNSSTLVVDVHDSTLVGSGTDAGSVIIAFDLVANSGATLHNIICETLGTTPAYVRGTTSGKIAASSNNLWHGSGAAPGFDSSPQTGDPLFTNAGADDYTIQSGSPAKNNGTATGAAADDYFGTPRPQLGTHDIGAQERPS